MKSILFVLVVGACILTGALWMEPGTGEPLSFGKDEEWSGEGFTRAKLDAITKLTGVKFPEGAEGVELFYQGSGLDDALAAKVRIPRQGMEEFSGNTVFSEGEAAAPRMEAGKGKAWWKVRELEERIDRKQSLPDARFLEVSVGKEGEEMVVYLSWFST